MKKLHRIHHFIETFFIVYDLRVPLSLRWLAARMNTDTCIAERRGIEYWHRT